MVSSRQPEANGHGEQNKVVKLIRPRRLPPAPPLPPKCSNSCSPAQSYSSLNRGVFCLNESVYYDAGPGSVQSERIAEQHRAFSPASTTYGYNSARSECGYMTQQFKNMSIRQKCCPNTEFCTYAPVSNASSESQILYSTNSVQSAPQIRKLRPKLSVSPVPVLKNQNASRPREHYKPTTYKRHIEQHIERLIKYINDRKKRLADCENDFVTRKLQPQDEVHIRKMLEFKEKSYLRSLRAKLSPRDFKKIADLGSGAIGMVSLVKKIDRDDINEESGTQNLYAMKKLNKTQVFQQNHIAHVMAERDILAEADNEWIVKLYHSFQDEKYLYFILEYLPGGDLMNLLIAKHSFPEDWARFYTAEISLALQFVHDMKFVHRDIKPDNILIDARGHIKLTDFGLCTAFRWSHDLDYYKDDDLSDTLGQLKKPTGDCVDHPTITEALAQRELEHLSKKRTLSLVGSPHYIAPELLKQQDTHSVNHARWLCDWWSVGVILYEMIVGHCPFINLSALYSPLYGPQYNPADELGQHIQMRILNWRDNLRIPPRVYNTNQPISAEANSLILGLLCDPNDRLGRNGIKDLQNHLFFRGVDWTKIRLSDAPYKPELSSPFDTRHFDSQVACREFEGTPPRGPNSLSEMHVNDFTRHCFWTKPT